MEIVEDRYGAGSTLITSQLPLSTWHDVIGEPTFADAILDVRSECGVLACRNSYRSDDFGNESLSVRGSISGRF